MLDPLQPAVKRIVGVLRLQLCQGLFNTRQRAASLAFIGRNPIVQALEIVVDLSSCRGVELNLGLRRILHGAQAFDVFHRVVERRGAGKGGAFYHAQALIESGEARIDRFGDAVCFLARLH